jgi:hypothetical protein
MMVSMAGPGIKISLIHEYNNFLKNCALENSFNLT